VTCISDTYRHDGGFLIHRTGAHRAFVGIAKLLPIFFKVEHSCFIYDKKNSVALVRERTIPTERLIYDNYDYTADKIL
jgi:hypothetical protein